MKCWTVSQIITDYIESELGDTERSLVEAHLKECSKCRFEFQRQKAFMEKLKVRDELNLEEGFWKKYKKELFEKIYKRTRSPFAVIGEFFGNAFSRRILYASAALVSVFVVVYFIKLTFREDNYFENYKPAVSSNAIMDKPEIVKAEEMTSPEGMTARNSKQDKRKKTGHAGGRGEVERGRTHNVYGLEVSEKEIEVFSDTIKEIESGEEFQMDDNASILTESQQTDVLAKMIKEDYL